MVASRLELEPIGSTAQLALASGSYADPLRAGLYPFDLAMPTRLEG